MRATLFSPDATLSWLSGEEAVKHFTVKGQPAWPQLLRHLWLPPAAL